MTEQRLVVDFTAPVGPFRGGAAGTLYGLGDNGVPTRAVLNGAHVTTSSQKAPGGAQHPSGDSRSPSGSRSRWPPAPPGRATTCSSPSTSRTGAIGTRTGPRSGGT